VKIGTGHTLTVNTTMDCLRIKFVLPANQPIGFRKNESLVLNTPEGKINLNINTGKIGINNYYVLKSEPLKEKLSNTTINKIKDSLYLTILENDIGLLINPKIASVFTKYGKEYISQIFGKKVESDFYGVDIVDCETKFPSSNPRVVARMSLDKFAEVLNKGLNSNYLPDEKLIRAIELYNSTRYLSRINISGRFILQVSAIECLIDQESVSKDIIDILDRAIKEVCNSKIDKNEKDSIQGSLRFLKKESIKRSGKNLIRELFKNSGESFSNLAPEEFFSKAYDLRSKLVHEGRTSTKFMNIDNPQLQSFTRTCIIRYFELYCIKK